MINVLHASLSRFQREAQAASALLRALGGARTDMAEHVGMDRSFISDLENGKKEICIRNLDLIAAAFNLTVSKLLARL